MPRNVRVPIPAGHRIPFDPVAMADAAVAAGKVHPRNRDAWLLRLARGGTVAAGAVMDLMRMVPADRATRAGWARQVRASRAQDGGQDDDDAVLARLWPTAEQIAQAQPHGREPDWLGAVETRQGWLTSQAAGAPLPSGYERTLGEDPSGGNPHHETIDHSALTIEAHDHMHSSYEGTVHRHPHSHSGDASHAPDEVNHIHQVAASDPVSAGIALRAAAAGGSPDDDDEDTWIRLFGREQ